MLNLKIVICLFIGVALLIVVFSFAHELPPVKIKTSYGSTFTISILAEAQSEWSTHELRLGAANNELQKLRYERDVISAAASKNRTEVKKFKTMVILIAGKQLKLASLATSMLALLDNGDHYQIRLDLNSKYSEINSQNSRISNAGSDRDQFYSEYVKRWDHQQTHLSSQNNPAPLKIHTPDYEYIPMLGADCANACGVFWYDHSHSAYYSGFPGGIGVPLSIVNSSAVSAHKSTCTGTASCDVGYWTCEGNESGGTARHKLRTCKIQGRQWNSGTSSYDTVTCNMDYRNCDNPGGRCFNGSSAGHEKHNDDVSGQNSYASISPAPTPTPTPTPSPTYHACEVHETSVSGDHSLQASCTSTDANGNSCTVTSFYACDSHTHSYPAPPPPPTTVSCARAACGAEVSDRLEHRVDNCSNCGSVYWTCYPNAIYNHETTFTCRRSGCGSSFTRCSNGSCSSDSGTHDYHWAQ